MKRYKFFLILIILHFTNINNSKAQFAGCDYESDNFRSFLYTKLLVVLDGTPKYNDALKQAVTQYWKATPYQFIDISQVDAWIENDRYSFLMPVTIEEIRNNDISTYIKRFNYLAVFVGGKDSPKKYDKSDLIAYAPYDFDHLEKEKEEAIFRLDLMIKSMNDAIGIVQREKMTGNFNQLQDEFIEYYNKKASTMAKKVLLLNIDYFNPKFNKFEFGKNYPYKYEISDIRTIGKLIRERDIKYLYLSLAYTSDKYIFIYNLFSGEVIFANAKIVGEVFNKKEVKNMVKKAG